MSKKVNIMSLSIETELHDLVKEHAKKRNMSTSEFVRKWLDKYPFNTDNVIPVVLDIPEGLTKDKDALSAFLLKKNQAIVSVLCG
jgi:hypothetical protein